ncbi:uncharacterized protein N7459_000459 [Penicillium hispanicum]|uniref:uncharacterized protein n=1 Tax=Penicillium hispanicum TaxID=1080232 RepID=UPI0025421E5F|nr:uncharacterized protein N7459_000459 [Penicillium hispanicum]KAJ5594251.1 hypothetical protein N7459_000459 [Penicillium hispanicum]
MLFQKIYLLFFLILDLSAAAVIKVFRDYSAPNYAGSDDSIYLWSSIATFNSYPTDGQVVKIAEDAYKSMLSDAWYNVDPERIPSVMTAMAYQSGRSRWEVYLASSARGTDSLIYEVTKAMNEPRNGAVWDTVPTSLKNALSACSRESTEKQHQFDAKCGEMNVMLEVAVNTRRDPADMASRSRIVSWQGQYNGENGRYRGGSIKPPCWSESGKGFGCRDTLRQLASNIDVLTADRESYANNMPVLVVPQPMFPGYEDC